LNLFNSNMGLERARVKRGIECVRKGERERLSY
jgi:hypothetical protein